MEFHTASNKVNLQYRNKTVKYPTRSKTLQILQYITYHTETESLVIIASKSVLSLHDLREVLQRAHLLIEYILRIHR